MKLFRVVHVTSYLLFMCCGLAQAEESLHPYLDDTFNIDVGAYFLDADVEYAITRHGDPEKKVSLGDLGINGNTTTPMLDLGWRFKQRWSLTANFYRFDEQGKLRNGKEFPIDGVLFPVGIALDSSVTVDTYVLNLGYSFIKDQRKELGIGLGVHGFDFEAKVNGFAIIGDDEIPIVDDSQDFVAPLPNIRVFGAYAFDSRWHATIQAAWLDADIDDYSGEMWKIDGKVEYRATKNLGVGAGYLWTSVDVTVEKNSKDEEYDLEFNGPLLYLSYNF